MKLGDREALLREREEKRRVSVLEQPRGHGRLLALCACPARALS